MAIPAIFKKALPKIPKMQKAKAPKKQGPTPEEKKMNKENRLLEAKIKLEKQKAKAYAKGIKDLTKSMKVKKD